MSTEVGEGNTVLPPDDLEAMLDLSKFLDQVSTPAAQVGPDGQTVALPLEAFQVLRQQRKRAPRLADLNELPREAAEAGLYETSADYAEALKRARKRIG